MNKRQRKKKAKKYIPIIVDEANLLTMTKEEQEKALADFENFRERHLYRKRYKDLKEAKRSRNRLVYYFPLGENAAKSLKEISSISRRTNKGVMT